jgi:hypothetical protein
VQAVRAHVAQTGGGLQRVAAGAHRSADRPGAVFSSTRGPKTTGRSSRWRRRSGCRAPRLPRGSRSSSRSRR